MRLIFYGSLLVASAFACTGKHDTEFEKEHREWQASRIERLKSRTGWLNLAGLYWLEEGDNSIGSDPSNSIRFPADAPDFAGSYLLRDGKIRYVPPEKGGVFMEDEPAVEMYVTTDRNGDPTVLGSGRFAWFIIERGNRFAVRLRDFENPAIADFHGIESYPIDPDWVVEAEYELLDTPLKVQVPSVTGSLDTSLCPGILHFSLEGSDYSLYPMDAGEKLFIIFADAGSGIETYGGGRFLYAEKPGKKGIVTLDFNRAYNPPCAFTPFATCPLPPRENQLGVAIRAGEKFGGH